MSLIKKYLNPQNDVAFERIFGTEKNKDILIAMLNAVLENPTMFCKFSMPHQKFIFIHLSNLYLTYLSNPLSAPKFEYKIFLR